jgi:anti-sigma regulatory factor (Ser/Thr protein kinase)
MKVAAQATDPYTRVWELTASDEEIPRVRREVLAVVREWDAARGAEYTVQLGVSELLANVREHAGDPCCRLELRRVGAAVFVFVHDRSAVPPRLVRPDASATKGRGLFLLRELADGFGWTRTDAGKRVWFVCGPNPVAAERDASAHG